MVDGTDAGISKKITLAIASVSQFVGSFIGASVNIALPSIGREFSMEAILLGWVVTSFFLASAAFVVPFGRLADIYGRKRIFTYGMLIFTVSSFLCAISNSAMWLIIFRVLQGITSAMTLGTAMAIVTSVFPARERGTALGVVISTVYLGLSLGPFLGGLLTQRLGWRSLFFVTAFLGLVVIILVFWKLKGEWAEARGERFDIVGSITFGFALIMIIYGFSKLPTMVGIVLMVLGVISMLAFIRWEEHTESPVVNMSLFRKNAVFAFSNLAVLINYCATFAITFLLSLYLQYVRGYSPQVSGLILVAQPVVMVICALIAGRLSDRLVPQTLASFGLAVSCVSLALLAFLTEQTSLTFVITVLVISGIGFGFFSSPNTNAIMGSVEKRFLGVASGMIAAARGTGMTLSLGIVMILFTVYIGNVQITPEYYPSFLMSMRVSFILFTILCLGGVFAQLVGRKA